MNTLVSNKRAFGHALTIRKAPRQKVLLEASSDLLPGFNASALDLSPLGAQLLVKKFITPQENVEVNLELKDGGKPLSLWANVRWCSGHSPYRAGVEFTGATYYQRKRIEEYL